MGGDHKCSVCQATFTRPQHVARHMRSHTGDRPYKCQHCGDQFARSDLLSRHVNKCHANEKPLLPVGARRKGSASLTRATTSKQACDQCVLSTLPCDGCNPCAKCVQRKCRCTFVKFHRQTLPSGPGHGNATRPASSSGRIQSYTDAPSFSYPEPLPASSSSPQLFSFYPPDNPNSLSVPIDYSLKYRESSELLRRTGSLPTLNHNAPAPFYPDPPASSSSWFGWSPEDPYGSLQHLHGFDTDSSDDHRFHDGKDTSSSFDSNHSFRMSRPYLEDALPSRDDAAASSPARYPATHPGSYPSHHHGLGRQPSIEFSSGGSSGSHSVRSSAPSSSCHLPLPEIQIPFQELQGALQNNMDSYPPPPHPPPPHHGQKAVGQGEGFSSVFGLMSLNDPNAIPGFNAESASFFKEGMSMRPHDPDETPMPAKSQQHGPQPPMVRQRSNTIHTPYGSTPSKESDMRTLREFWKEYMRTPLSGPGSAVDGSSGGGNNTSNSGSPMDTKRSRVASMSALADHGPSHFDGDAKGGGGGGGVSSIRTTLHGNVEDLRSYEAAVLARKTPTNLNLVPRRQRSKPAGGCGSGGSSSSSSSPGDTTAVRSRSAVVPSMNPPSLVPTPSSLSAAFFGRFDPSLVPPPPVHPFASPMVPSLSSSRESSVSADSDKDMMLRPAFKRLPSQTLEPVTAKRALIGDAGDV